MAQHSTQPDSNRPSHQNHPWMGCFKVADSVSVSNRFFVETAVAQSGPSRGDLDGNKFPWFMPRMGYVFFQVGCKMWVFGAILCYASGFVFCGLDGVMLDRKNDGALLLRTDIPVD